MTPGHVEHCQVCVQEVIRYGYGEGGQERGEGGKGGPAGHGPGHTRLCWVQPVVEGAHHWCCHCGYSGIPAACQVSWHQGALD